MAVPNTLSRIEALPDDMIIEILTRVARTSRRDIRQVMASCPELAKHAKDKQVSKNLTLKPLAKNPKWSINNYHLIERCIESGNPEAHYIKGIQQYFLFNNTATGLHHLRKAAEGLYDDGTYLYGLLMLCRGHKDEGKSYLDKIQWRVDKSRGDRCWRHVKKSLQGFRVSIKKCYIKSLKKNKPTKLCNLNDMDTTCKKCYYYKQMRKFVNIKKL